MDLKKQILEDIKQAMRSKNQSILDVLRFLLSQIKQKEIDSRPTQLSDLDRVKVIQKQIQKIKDSLEQFKIAKREDLIEKTKKELEIYKKYLPQPLENKELEFIVQKSIEDLKADSIKQMGLVIKDVISRTKGRAENKIISQMVRKHLEL